MRAHYLQHVPFEGLGRIAGWLDARDASVTATRLYENADLPAVDELDWLIVMGGPMGANDDHVHPWLAPERALIADAVAAGKVVLGICLGSQLLAKALGASVYKNAEFEIGWLPVEPVAGQEPIASPIEAFHWHGDTFDLPAGATHLSRSEGCAHQAYSVGSRVLGLQFHLEVTEAGARAMFDASRHEIRAAPRIQSEEEIFRDRGRFERANRVMWRTLDWLARQGP